ncbi:hypothetical protein C8035_v006946 [Colletotrichum spinosum]|uniref:ATP-grasp domain-containing protein n=1 Tax=Colletotrichum spinosum TaxID=1347390 RepID=A0A4R8QW05_9PEZI|nr:hypothetical protein C8035_v006946 [Colletotrichum spinosum]
MAAADRSGQVLKNLTLIAASFVFLPVDTALLALCYAWRQLYADGEAARPADGQQRTVLVTGVGMTKGLALARLFHEAGHRVVGADFSPWACGSRSRALSAYHVLKKPGRGGADPYLDSVLRIVKAEGVDLWVSCSGVGSAIEDGIVKEVIEARTGCKAVQFDVARTETLHQKDSFMAYTRDVAGLEVPESHLITRRDDMIAALDKAAGLSHDAVDEKSKGKQKRFIVKAVGMNDRGRGDMTLLPLPTEKQTYDFINRLERLGMSDKEPWLLQEFIQGQEFCTHSLVVRGEVRAFVACRSAELLMHYVALPADSALSLAMLGFTKTQAASFGSSFTGHLSFDFIISDTDVAKAETCKPEELSLYPIECNPRAHTAVALFANTPEMVEQYLAVVDGTPATEVVTPKRPAKYYWAGHDLFTLFVLPTLRLLLLRTTLMEYVGSVRRYVEHVAYWKDGTFEAWDPLPAWWLYHVYWPLMFWDCIMSRRSWSRVNVSTTKMFECD